MKLIKSILICLFLVSCSYTDDVIRGKGDLRLTRAEYSALKDWSKDDHRAALLSFLNSCSRFAKMKGTDNVGNKIGIIKASDFRDVCHVGSEMKDASSTQIKNFFENWFVPYEVSTRNGNNLGKFTGYFEPVLEGSLVKTDIYKYPIYAKPQNYDQYSREEIESGALNGKKLELLYVKDNVDLFFMHIQGTGKVRLENGEILKVSFGGKNDYKYTSIGKYMIDNNVMGTKNHSYDLIKNWLKNNPKEGQEIMNLNESYIFFRISPEDNTIGAQLVPLTPERSLAIDKDLLPYGYPIWLEVKSKKNNQNIYNKLLVTQDTGSAIKGAVRGDIFFGAGNENEKMAATMNNYGSYYIFLPANVVPYL